MAQLRNKRGRKGVVDMNFCGPNYMRLRQREVDIVRPVDAVEFNLWGTGIGEGESVTILAGKNSGASWAGSVDGIGGVSAGSFELAVRTAWLRQRLGAEGTRLRSRIGSSRSLRWTTKWTFHPVYSCLLSTLTMVSFRPRMEIWKMRTRLRNTWSVSRDSPQPSHESARE